MMNIIYCISLPFFFFLVFFTSSLTSSFLQVLSELCEMAASIIQKLQCMSLALFIPFFSGFMLSFVDFTNSQNFTD